LQQNQKSSLCHEAHTARQILGIWRRSGGMDPVLSTGTAKNHIVWAMALPPGGNFNRRKCVISCGAGNRERLLRAMTLRERERWRDHAGAFRDRTVHRVRRKGNSFCYKTPSGAWVSRRRLCHRKSVVTSIVEAPICLCLRCSIDRGRPHRVPVNQQSG